MGRIRAGRCRSSSRLTASRNGTWTGYFTPPVATAGGRASSGKRAWQGLDVYAVASSRGSGTRNTLGPPKRATGVFQRAWKTVLILLQATVPAFQAHSLLRHPGKPS